MDNLADIICKIYDITVSNDPVLSFIEILIREKNPRFSINDIGEHGLDSEFIPILRETIN